MWLTSNLMQRLAVAFVFAPLIVWVLLAGGSPLRMFCTAISLLMAFEYSQLLLQKEQRLSFLLAVCVYLACYLLQPPPFFVSESMWHAALLRQHGLIVLLLVLTLELLLMALRQPAAVDVKQWLKQCFEQCCYKLFGIVYTGGLFVYLLELRLLDEQGLFALNAMSSIWIADSVAYFIGKRYGRFKLVPILSPGKTVEGAIAGVVGGSLFAMLLASLMGSRYALWQWAVFGFLAALFGLLGDILESLLKRLAGVKDSSQLIPGHGGVLDRFDATLLAFPVLYYWAIHMVGSWL